MKTKDEHILSWLQEKGSAEVQDFAAQYQKLGEPILENTLRWKLYHWASQRKIYRIGRGKYSPVGPLKPFSAMPQNTFLEQMAYYLKGKLNDTTLCVWDTSLLANYSLHLPAKNYGIIELGKNELEYAMDALMNNDYFGPYVFDCNDSTAFKGCLNRSKVEQRPVILKKLLQDAPLDSSGGLHYPTIEKVIVDLICEPNFFFAFQGQDLNSILESFHIQHLINFDKLHNYASYRNRADEVNAKISPFKELQQIDKVR